MKIDFKYNFLELSQILGIVSAKSYAHIFHGVEYVITNKIEPIETQIDLSLKTSPPFNHD